MTKFEKELSKQLKREADSLPMPALIFEKQASRTRKKPVFRVLLPTAAAVLAAVLLVVFLTDRSDTPSETPGGVIEHIASPTPAHIEPTALTIPNVVLTEEGISVISNEGTAA